jgi:hypothetical protein
MRKFWLLLWGYWAFWLTLFSAGFAAVTAMIATAVTYVITGSAQLSEEIWLALYDLFAFWFAIFWSLGLPLGLLLVVKRLFYRCVGGFQMHFLQCPSRTEIRDLKVSDTFRLWRKWLLTLIWMVATQIIVIVAIRYFAGSDSLMGWFNVFWLYSFLMISGMLTLPLMGARCKMVQVKRC